MADERNVLTTDIRTRLDAREEWAGNTRVLRATGSRGSRVALLMLPSISGFQGDNGDLYESVGQRLRFLGEVITCEYPGLGGSGSFSVELAARDVSVLLACIERQNVEVRVFAACTGFLLALEALLQGSSSRRVTRLFGWHVPRRMAFSTARLQRFEQAYGMRWSRGAESDHSVPDLLGCVAERFSDLHVTIARGRATLEDDPAVEYLQIPASMSEASLQCARHIPRRGTPAFDALVDRAVCELSADLVLGRTTKG